MTESVTGVLTGFLAWCAIAYLWGWLEWRTAEYRKDQALRRRRIDSERLSGED